MMGLRYEEFNDATAYTCGAGAQQKIYKIADWINTEVLYKYFYSVSSLLLLYLNVSSKTHYEASAAKTSRQYSSLPHRSYFRLLLFTHLFVVFATTYQLRYYRLLHLPTPPSHLSLHLRDRPIQTCVMAALEKKGHCSSRYRGAKHDGV